MLRQVAKSGRGDQGIPHDRVLCPRTDTTRALAEIIRYWFRFETTDTIDGDRIECLGPTSVAPSDGHAMRRSPTWKFNKWYKHVGEFLGRTCSRQCYAA